jgi:ABC-type Fe3+ transport system permease subunit
MLWPATVTRQQAQSEGRFRSSTVVLVAAGIAGTIALLLALLLALHCRRLRERRREDRPEEKVCLPAPTSGLRVLHQRQAMQNHKRIFRPPPV